MTIRTWCKQNQVSEPTYYKYLKRIRQELCDTISVPVKETKEPVEVMPTMKLDDKNLDKLLPWSREFPSYVKTLCNSVDFTEEKRQILKTITNIQLYK